MSTENHHPTPGDEPTAPLPRTSPPPAADDAAGDPTLVLETAADRPGATPTEPVRTSTPQTTGRRSPRVGTVVWGLVVAVIGAGVISVAAGARVDVELALIALLALAGAALVAGSIASGMRHRR